MSLSVATLNMLDDLAFWRERSPLIVEEFRELRPDVIALQEVSLASPSVKLEGARSTAHWLADQLGGYGVALCPHSSHPASDSLAILTRWTVDSHDILKFEAQGRQAQRVRIRRDDETWTVVNTHLYWHPLGDATRVQQVSQLKEWLDGAAPAVVCGDFNAMPASGTLRRFGERFTSAHVARHGKDPLLTYPTLLRRGSGLRHWGRHATLRANGLIRLRHNMRFGGTVDYIMVDASVQVEECDVVFRRPSPLDPQIYASDHLGLFAVLGRPDPIASDASGAGAREDREE